MTDHDGQRGARIEHLTEEEARVRGMREGATYTTDVGAFEVAMWWPLDGSDGPAELTIKVRPDADAKEVARGITTGTLRAVPLAQITQEMREARRATRQTKQDTTHAGQVADDMISYIRDAVAAHPKPGSKGRPDRFYIAVATVYSLYAGLHYHNPIHLLGKACGVDRKAAANWVRFARTKGFLSEPTPGQPGGAVTDRAIEILNQEGK